MTTKADTDSNVSNHETSGRQKDRAPRVVPAADVMHTVTNLGSNYPFTGAGCASLDGHYTGPDSITHAPWTRGWSEGANGDVATGAYSWPISRKLVYRPSPTMM